MLFTYMRSRALEIDKSVVFFQSLQTQKTTVFRNFADQANSCFFFRQYIRTFLLVSWLKQNFRYTFYSLSPTFKGLKNIFQIKYD